MNYSQEDVTHLIQTLDRAIEQLSNARKLLQEGQKGALHSIVEGSSMATYARKLAVKLAQALSR